MGTQGISGFISGERARLFDDASPERREQLRAAERRGAVFSAFNAVVRNTREGGHVTGLHYVPEQNELVAYVDTPAWTQELTMLREIVRARMAAAGADVSAVTFRTSREGYRSNLQRAAAAAGGTGARPARREPKSVPPRAPLAPEQEAELAREVAPIEDAALRQALMGAMRASLEWKMGQDDSEAR